MRNRRSPSRTLRASTFGFAAVSSQRMASTQLRHESPRAIRWRQMIEESSGQPMPAGAMSRWCWWRHRKLEAGQPLRELLQAGRFMSLLPLVHLLRRVAEYDEWSRPPPRAVFLFDDPNLHWPSYGFIRFAELAEKARIHRFHVAVAMVPLDGWFAHPGAVRIFTAENTRLSLAFHGNDHTHTELEAPLPLEQGVPVFDQALQRILGFERRTGLTVDRVMIPPHGLCSDEMLTAMAVPGLQALCRASGWWSGWTDAAKRSARWAMADVSPSAVPVLGRRLLSGKTVRDDVALDLYLDQPAILYGHHQDLRNGYELIADTASWLNTFEGLEWASLGSLARTNLATRSAGSRMYVRAFTRHATVPVPSGITDP